MSSPYPPSLPFITEPAEHRTSSWVREQSQQPSSDPVDSFDPRTASPDTPDRGSRYLESHSPSFGRFAMSSPLSTPSQSSAYRNAATMQPQLHHTLHLPRTVSPARRHLSWNQRLAAARAGAGPGVGEGEDSAHREEYDLTNGLGPFRQQASTAVPASDLPSRTPVARQASGSRQLFGEIASSPASASGLNPEARVYTPLSAPAIPDDLDAPESSTSAQRPVAMNGGGSHSAPIEILDDSDDEIEVVGVRRNAQPAVRFPEASAGLQALDDVLNSRAAEAQALMDAETDPRRRQILSRSALNSPPPVSAPIRLGGAIRTNGSNVFSYAPAPAGDGVDRRIRQLRQRIEPRGLPVYHEHGAAAGADVDSTVMDPDGPTAAAVRRHAAPDYAANNEAARPYDHRAAPTLNRRNWVGSFAQRLENMGGAPVHWFNQIRNIGGSFGLLDPATLAALTGGQGIGGSWQREEDINRVLEKVVIDDFGLDAPAPPFVSNFDISEGGINGNPIEIDTDRPKRRKPYMACVNCSDALLLSSAYRGPDDRIVALRCGHVIDQKCLAKLSAPTEEEELHIAQRQAAAGLPVLGEEPPVKKARRSKRQPKKKDVDVAPEYVWMCPVAGCGEKHVSVKRESGWEQQEGLGATVVYA